MNTNKSSVLAQISVHKRFLFFFLTAVSAATASPLTQLKPFLSQHCTDCHGAEKQKGELRFDTLGTDLSKIETLEVWQGILDQLNLGEMPPEKAPQPTREEIDPVVETLTAELAEAYDAARSTGGQTVMRRLNRHELRNTFRDLLYLNGAEYRPGAGASRLVDNNGNGSVERTGNDPLRFFPEDEEEHGFYNLGDKLVMSDFFLKLMLDAAEEVLGQATHLEAKPKLTPHHFEGLMHEPNRGHWVERVSREREPGYELMAFGYERFGRLSPHELRGGVGVAAPHRITVEVSAHRSTPRWRERAEVDTEDPFEFNINIADARNGGIAGPSSTQVQAWKIAGDGKKHTFTAEVWMDPGWTVWLGWENGPAERALRSDLLAEKFAPDKFHKRPDKNANKEAHDRWPLTMAGLLFEGGQYAGPHLRVHRLSVEPLLETWPPRSHTALYGSGSGEEKEVRELLTKFAERAFRRPVTAEEVEPFVQLVLRQNVEPMVTLPSAIKDLRYKLYEGKWDKLPDFATLKPVREAALPDGRIDIRAAGKPDYFAMVFEGTIETERPGEYLFEMASDDAGRLSVDGEKVIEHDGLHGAELRKGTIRLEPGEHKLRVEYVAYGLPNSFRAGWSGPGSPHVQLTAQPLHQPKSNNKPKEKVPRYIRAMQDGYAAILCSPGFLYLKEKPGRLDEFALASRLSYFLWSSMPDETLFELARAGKLSQPAELDRQVERMLRDPKAAAFTRHFPAAWLRLDKLGKMPPSGGDFQFYKNLRVEPMLHDQVTTYFKDVLDSNGGIERFIDSDYTYMNHVLGKWIYRREDIRGYGLRKVKLDDPRRGGIFTLPGVMTATANGVDTSPVIRGAWVLENVLGTPPPPPPPDVEPLPSDTREATTIRELLELHRKNDACYSCHAKIDPMGFAFENFDVVGRWRDKYKRAKDPIDTAATLANGREVADIVEFKAMLMDRKDLVARCLAEKLLTYATGRHLEALDRGELDRIVREAGANGNRLRDLIHLVVKSEVFLTK